MNEILTPAQVARLKASYTDPYDDVRILDLCDSHEALREQLAASRADLKAGSHLYAKLTDRLNDTEAQLAEAQGAIQAVLACLAQPHSSRPNWHVAKGQARAFQDAVVRLLGAAKETP